MSLDHLQTAYRVSNCHILQLARLTKVPHGLKFQSQLKEILDPEPEPEPVLILLFTAEQCAEPAAEGIFANFSLLLTEDPVEEPDVIDLGTVYEEDRTKFPWLAGSQDEDDEDIDWDDRLHFPAGQKEIDISKNPRDIIHLEITLDAFCSSACKGLCLVCGTNLNTSSCSCSAEESLQARRPGTLKDLPKPMQRR